MRLNLVLSGLLIYFSSSVAFAAEIRVLAAASLQPAMQQLIKTYQVEHPKAEITLITGASSTLARQIEEGAPVDIYISANQTWMDYLQEKLGDKIVKTSPLLANKLVVVAKTASADFDITQLTSWQTALAGKRLAMADSQHVPAGMYAEQAMTKMGIWNELKPNMAFSHNVRSTLALVERGAAPLGVVYASDASTSKLVVALAQFPDSSHEPIVYPAGLLSSQDTATAFYAYLWAEQGQATWQQYGFTALATE